MKNKSIFDVKDIKPNLHVPKPVVEPKETSKKSSYMLYLTLGIPYIIGLILNMVIHTIFIPINFVKQILSFKTFYLTHLPEHVRQYILDHDKYWFDENGLLHHIDDLNKINIRDLVTENDMKALSKYVDIDTYSYVHHPETSTLKAIETELGKNPIFSVELEQEDYTFVNATHIGNFAYIALHGPVKADRQTATQNINDLKEYFGAFK